MWTAIFVRGLVGIAKTRVLVPVLEGARGEVREAARASVTVLVPARNEAEVIARSVRAVLDVSQAADVASVIVVDDGSTDGTRAELDRIAKESPRLEVLSGRGPAPGECGKPAALAFAYAEAAPATEWLLFVDADVVLAPGAVAALIAAASSSGSDLVSVIPQLEMGGAVEKLVMPSIGALVLAQYPPERVARADDPVAFANGQVILVRREVYEKVGGHRAVVKEILEDVRLAALVKAAGGRLLVANGRAIASTRMYASFAELVEGWSKNLFLLMGGKVSAAVRWVLISVLFAWAGVVLAAVYGWPVGVSGYLIILTYQGIIRAKGGASPVWALLAPVAAVIAAWILLRSTLLFWRRAPIAWKGRSYGA